jgi:hypothetical protein
MILPIQSTVLARNTVNTSPTAYFAQLTELRVLQQSGLFWGADLIDGLLPFPAPIIPRHSFTLTRRRQTGGDPHHLARSHCEDRYTSDE